MGNDSSKPSKMKKSNQNATISKLTLPEHTNNPSGFSARQVPNIKFSSPRQLRQSQSNIQTPHGNHHSQIPQTKFESPYSVLNTTYKPQVEPLNSNVELRATNQSMEADSLRETHLNENTKKSTLKLRFENNPDKVSKSALQNVNKPEITQNLKARSALNPKVNVISSDGSTQKPSKVLIKHNDNDDGNELLLLPSNIDEIRTVRMTEKSQSHQLNKSNKSYQKGHGYLMNSQRTLNQMVEDEEFYKNRGYFLLTDTDMGEKKVSETTKDGESSEMFGNGIVEWIAAKFCGTKEENPQSEVQIEKGCECELFKTINKQTMMKREEQDNFQLPNSYNRKRLELSENP